MPKIAYEDWNPKEATLTMVHHANGIIKEYADQGYDLTLRQLYYQFVSRDLLPNKQSEYKRLGDIVSKARRAGMIDWDAIIDRTRNLQRLSTWNNPADIIQAVAEQFRYDYWKAQPQYVEVWFEKDALMGVFQRAANPWRVPFFSCRGYTSDSEVWGAAQRLYSRTKRKGLRATILHFGDHDPSGLDMTRDIRERLALFGAGNVDVRRLALNMDQVDEYEPPPNPAKETDSRFSGYQAEYGDESWELDALDPTTLGALVDKEIKTLVDADMWNASVEEEQRARGELTMISDEYDMIIGNQDEDELQATIDRITMDNPLAKSDKDEDDEETEE